MSWIVEWAVRESLMAHKKYDWTVDILPYYVTHNKHPVLGVTDFSISKNEACPHEMNSHHWMWYGCTM